MTPNNQGKVKNWKHYTTQLKHHVKNSEEHTAAQRRKETGSNKMIKLKKKLELQ